MLAAARTVPPPAAVEMAQPTLFVLVKTKFVSATELPPALTVMLPCVLATVTLAVNTLAAMPKLTLFELLNVNALACAPTAFAARITFALAVMVLPAMPKDTLLEWLQLKAEPFALTPFAPMLTAVRLLATEPMI